MAKIGLGIHYDTDALSSGESTGTGLTPRYELDSNAVISIDLFSRPERARAAPPARHPGIKGIVLHVRCRKRPHMGLVHPRHTRVRRPRYGDSQRHSASTAASTPTATSAATSWPQRVVSGHDITFEAAITKMMFLFGLGLDTDEVKRRLGLPLPENFR